MTNQSCLNTIGVTETITAVQCRSDAGSNTTTVNPTFGSTGTGTTICSGALTCGNERCVLIFLHGVQCLAYQWIKYRPCNGRDVNWHFNTFSCDIHTAMTRLLLILGLLCVAAAAQTPALITGAGSIQTCGFTGPSSCTTSAIVTTGATLTIIAIGQVAALTTFSVSSSPSCTWVPLTQQQDVSSGNVQIFYAYNCAGASQTFTCSGTFAAAGTCYVMAFTGGGLFDAQNGAISSGSVGSLATGSVTLASANDLVFSAWSSNSGNSTKFLSINSGLATAGFYGNNGNRQLAIAFGPLVNFTPCGTGTCMTSNTVPSPFVASADQQTNPAYASFDGVLGDTGWLSSNPTTAYLCLDLGSGHATPLYFYSWNGLDTTSRDPASYAMKGSNTSCTASLTTLDSQSSIPFNVSGSLIGYGSSDTSTSYRYYVLGISSNNGDTDTGVCELNLWKASTFGGSVNPTMVTFHRVGRHGRSHRSFQAGHNWRQPPSRLRC